MSEGIGISLGMVPGALGWLQGHHSGSQGLVAPGGKWPQVESGSKWQVALGGEWLQVLWNSPQCFGTCSRMNKYRGTSMERVQSGCKVKVGSWTKWCTMSQEIEEVHVCISLQYSESLVNS